MTDEQLFKANELHEKIKETTKMISDLQNGYMNTINAVSFCGEKKNSSYAAFSEGDELHTMILNYYKNHLEILQKEFKNL